MNTEVIVSGHRYIVKVAGHQYVVTERETIGKDKICSCGMVNCDHVRSVAVYLKAGGQKANGEQVAPHIEEPSLLHPHFVVPQQPRPYVNPYGFAWHLERVKHLKEVKAMRDARISAGDCLAVEAYWHDFYGQLNPEREIPWLTPFFSDKPDITSTSIEREVDHD